MKPSYLPPETKTMTLTLTPQQIIATSPTLDLDPVEDAGNDF